MLSGQSTSRPRLTAHGRNRGHDHLSPKDGYARGTETVSPAQPRDRVLPRLDQKQTGTTSVPPARLGESANGNALGLSYLQPATMDPPAQTASRTHRRLNPQPARRKPKHHPTRELHFPLLDHRSLIFPAGAWFFHSFKARRVDWIRAKAPTLP